MGRYTNDKYRGFDIIGESCPVVNMSSCASFAMGRCAGKSGGELGQFLSSDFNAKAELSAIWRFAKMYNRLWNQATGFASKDPLLLSRCRKQTRIQGLLALIQTNNLLPLRSCLNSLYTAWNAWNGIIFYGIHTKKLLLIGCQNRIDSKRSHPA